MTLKNAKRNLATYEMFVLQTSFIDFVKKMLKNDIYIYIYMMFRNIENMIHLQCFGFSGGKVD